MTKPLVFMMGRSPAFLPLDRGYARNHMWAAADGRGRYRFGFSAYAVRLLGEIRMLEWSVEPGAYLEPHQPMGSIEGSKAVSDVYAPLAGLLVQINPQVLADPTLINSDLYQSGWLFDLECAGEELLSAQQYLAHLEACWPLAQRMLKGQVSVSRPRAQRRRPDDSPDSHQTPTGSR